MTLSHQPEASEDDVKLVERARAGDRAAWLTLYRRYVGELFGFCFNELGAAQDAEDVVAETFLRVVNGLHSFDGRSSFRTWLYSIARNQLRDRWRRSGRRPQTIALTDAAPLHLRVAASADHEQESDPHPQSTAFGRAVLDALPPHYRRVLTLRIMDGRSIRDTAEEMGIQPGNVKVMQHRALKRARIVAQEMEAPARVGAVAPTPVPSTGGAS